MQRSLTDPICSKVASYAAGIRRVEAGAAYSEGA